MRTDGLSLGSPFSPFKLFQRTTPTYEDNYISNLTAKIEVVREGGISKHDDAEGCEVKFNVYESASSIVELPLNRLI